MLCVGCGHGLSNLELYRTVHIAGNGLASAMRELAAPIHSTGHHIMAHLLCGMTRHCCWIAAQHEATMLFDLSDLAEAGIVSELVAHGPALGGALYYLATALVVGGRPFPREHSQYAP